MVEGCLNIRFLMKRFDGHLAIVRKGLYLTRPWLQTFGKPSSGKQS